MINQTATKKEVLDKLVHGNILVWWGNCIYIAPENTEDYKDTRNFEQINGSTFGRHHLWITSAYESGYLTRQTRSGMSIYNASNKLFAAIDLSWFK